MDLSSDAWTFLGVLAANAATLGGVALNRGRKARKDAQDAAQDPQEATSTLTRGDVATVVRDALEDALEPLRRDVSEVRTDMKTHLRDHAVTFAGMQAVPRQRARG